MKTESVSKKKRKITMHTLTEVLHNFDCDCSLIVNNQQKEPSESRKKSQIGGRKRFMNCSLKKIKDQLCSLKKIKRSIKSEHTKNLSAIFNCE